MATLVIPNTFATGGVISAAEHNANNTAIAASVNSITNAQVNAAAAIEESKILFEAGATAHDHTGTTKGKVLTGAAVETAVANGAKGTIVWKSGTQLVTNGSGVTITFGTTFSAVPLIMVYYDSGGLIGVGNKDYGNTTSGYYIGSVAATGFEIWNSTGGDETFTWVAVGV